MPFVSSAPYLSTGDWREQLKPVVTRLKECVTEVVEKAKKAMTFVLLQEAVCSIPQGFLLQQRRDVVFSQAVGVDAVVGTDWNCLGGLGAAVEYNIVVIKRSHQ